VQGGRELHEQPLQILQVGPAEIGQRPIQSIDDQLDEIVDGAMSRRGKPQFHLAAIVIAPRASTGRDEPTGR
jgi:hypothetical protein